MIATLMNQALGRPSNDDCERANMTRAHSIDQGTAVSITWCSYD